VRLFKLCMNIGNAPLHWISAIIVSLFKGKVIRMNIIIKYRYIRRYKFTQHAWKSVQKRNN
jgi:hypothetical protein